MEAAKEEAKRAATETERLLQLVQMSQEEQNSKEKTIMDLQQWVISYLIITNQFNPLLSPFLPFFSTYRALKNAQAKIKASQQQQAQADVS